ncbi:hypothetical protein P4V49_07645 [Brevibacillus parabrevis]|uniref:Uncharacterized protein n=2 Tax=Brevibacillus TaxID=55080 RepID=A0A4Y3PSM2_BREPA|nr:hypothetical protein [Brevibacillus parabrevis]MED2254528.1 hypothetical protein [Brevibacillus parabrevis]WDV93719.1 hypothetical protein PSE45_18940 [Brevibacillus parabrevis]GEB34388.1 hypothetical protein BPA01_39680 [Brevibacillus parabrevis]
MEVNELTAFLDLDSATLLDKVLKMEQSPVRIASSEAIVEITYQPHQVYDLAHRFLRDTQTPKKLEQIVAELRRQTQFGWNQILRMLQLERDPRFVQYQGDDRWFLAEWTQANDQVYDFCRDNGITHVAARSLVHFLEQEVGIAGDAAFLPLLDDRFRVEGETLYIIVRSEETDEELAAEEIAAADSSESIAVIENETEEVAPETASPLHQEPKQEETIFTKEETNMTNATNVRVLEEVQQLLQEAISRLEGRNQEMSQEVVAHFQQSNMQAIEVLMKEKHKHEQIVLGIQQVLATSEQQ